MATPTSFRDLRLWQNAMQLTVDIYHFCGSLPSNERPGLATQLQQAASAIPTLVATGHKTGSRTGLRASCERAITASTELETLLIITGQLYPNVPSNDLLDQLEEVQQMLIAAVKKLAAGSAPNGGPRKAI